MLHLVKEVVKRPPQIRGDEVRSPGNLQMKACHSCSSCLSNCVWEGDRSQEQLGIRGVRNGGISAGLWGDGLRRAPEASVLVRDGKEASFILTFLLQSALPSTGF